jgi:acetyl-CoA synthetase
MVATDADARQRYDALFRRSLEDPERFWLEVANEVISWTQPPDRAFEQPDPPSFRWFPGGRTNLAYNALDRHVAGGRGEHPALVGLNERGERQQLTYAQLHEVVEAASAALRALGIGHGDRVTIYMPTCVEAIVAMLATVRIGAVHNVVFAGFGAGALGDRIRASGSRLVIGSDVTYRKGNEVDLRSILAEALAGSPHDVEHVVMLER